MKALKILLALALVVVMGAALVSCDINPMTIWQEKIAPLFHEHEVVIDEAVAATCENEGLTEGSHCSVCGEVIVAQNIVDAVSHTIVVDKAIDPTCTKTGLTVGTHCSMCGGVLLSQKVVPANGHSFLGDACEVCGVARYTEGLTYELTEQGEYIVTGIGTATDSEIIIPAELDGHRVVAIGKNAFEWNYDITSVVIPEGVKKIDYRAFAYCANLVSVVFSNGLEEIGDYAFSHTHINSLNIPGSVRVIGGYAFEGIRAISIVIPDGVEEIGEAAFRLCYSLTSITIPATVTKIGDNVVNTCFMLTDIHFGGTRAQWKALVATMNSWWDTDTGDYTVYCSDGNIKK